MEKVLWTMKNGKQIDVDDMDLQHLRNTLKMLLRTIQKQKLYIARPRVLREMSAGFRLNGEMAQAFVNEMEDMEMLDEMDMNDFEPDYNS